jgi:hypothetical protein
MAGAAVTTGAGSQYTPVRFTETLTLAGLPGSTGTAGDAYDNALAETTVGLYKSARPGTGTLTGHRSGTVTPMSGARPPPGPRAARIPSKCGRGSAAAAARR